MAYSKSEKQAYRENLSMPIVFGFMAPVLVLVVATLLLRSADADAGTAVLAAGNATAEDRGEPLSPEEDRAIREAAEKASVARGALEQCGALGFFAHPDGWARWRCFGVLNFVWARWLAWFLLLWSSGCLGLLAFALRTMAKGPEHEERGAVVGAHAIKVFGVVHGVVYLPFVMVSSLAASTARGSTNWTYIAVIAAIALGAGLLTIRGLFFTTQSRKEVFGTPLDRSKAPELWRRVDALAVAVGVEPPGHVVVGIDENMFVSETGLDVTDVRAAELWRMDQRVLFVSLPLLELLTTDEAEVLLAHELEHFAAGEEQRAVRFNEHLATMEGYAESVKEGFSFGVGSLMAAYVYLVRRQHSRYARAAELQADVAAVGLRGKAAFAGAVTKMTAFAALWKQVEHEFMSSNQLDRQPDVAGALRASFPSFLAGPFRHELQRRTTPHPYDEHPDLVTRFANVGLAPPTEGQLHEMSSAPGEGLLSAIPDAQDIARELWALRGRELAEQREVRVAERIDPSTADEAAHVESFYPQRTFHDVFDEKYVVDWQGLTVGSERHAFDAVYNITYSDKWLVIYLSRREKKKVRLIRIPEGRIFARTVHRYYQRHRAAARAHLRSETS